MTNPVTPVGTHCILELHGCPFELLDGESFVRDALADASRQGMSTLLNLTSHRFAPHGVTALALLAESHISAHTWPEHGYVALDVFTCGEKARPMDACAFLVERFQASEYALKELPRGAALADHRVPAGTLVTGPQQVASETDLCPVSA